MKDKDRKPRPRQPYAPPAVVRVHVDPVKDLLQETECLFAEGQSDTCDQNPC